MVAHSHQGPYLTVLLFVLSVTVSGRYLWWRYTSTIHADGAISLFLSCLLLAAETYAFIVMVLGYFQVCWPLDRRPKRLPADRSTWPTVDIFIPTYNESLEVIKPTVFARKTSTGRKTRSTSTSSTTAVEIG